MQTSPPQRRIASTIGKYRLIAELGRGGMATVYLAVTRGHGGFNKLVVLKVPRPDIASDPNLLAMFIDEARIAARLSHPNVVQTFEILRAGELDILVMEYLDGYTLHELIARSKKQNDPLAQAMHLQIISDALTGLHYAHEAKDFDGSALQLVHRDVSPHNVFLTFDGQVKLLDFGIAKGALQSHQTEFGTFKGKVRYMPREQLAGTNMDRRTDVFAAGAMIWEAAVGERLWKKQADVEVISAILSGEIPMPRAVRPDVPEALEAICRKALAFEKADRYADCLELQSDLDRYLLTTGQKPAPREVIACLARVFAEPRASRKAIIDQQLSAANLLDGDDVLPLATLPPTAPTSMTLPALNQTQSGSGSVSRSTEASTATIGAGVSTDDVREGPRKSRTGVYVGLGVVSLMALGGGTVFLVKAKNTAASVVRAPPPAPPPTPPPHAPPPSAVQTPPEHVEAIDVATAPSLVVVPTSNRPPPGTRPGIAPVIAASTGFSPAPGKPPPSAVTAEPGTFSFTTYPWTRVSDGGRLLGTTPLYKVSLSPGPHVLTLENADEGVKTSYTVLIKSGENVNRSMSLK